MFRHGRRREAACKAVLPQICAAALFGSANRTPRPCLMGRKPRHLKKFLKNNELAYRTCILYESFHGKPAQEVYEKMLKVFPKKDYSTFQYWYFRFLNGYYDLNHDPSLDPKTRSFPEVPAKVMKKIVGYMDLVDTLSAGKVCRKLRKAVKRVKKTFDRVNVRFKLNHVIVESGLQSIVYQSNQNGGACCTVRRKKGGSTKNLEGCDYLEMALRYISSFLKNRNWAYQELEFEFEPESERSPRRKAYKKQCSCVTNILSRSTINAERLIVNAWNSDLEPMEMLLPYMKADVLKSIKFKCEAFEEKSIEKIMDMDQWKRAKELDLSYIPDWFKKDKKEDEKKFFSCLLHAERFSVHKCTFTMERLNLIAYHCFTNPNFKGCFLRSNVYQCLPTKEYPLFLVERAMPAYRFWCRTTKRYYKPQRPQLLFNITATEVKCGPHRMLEYVELRIERIRNQNS
ncbi:unnamed protein product [Caenorhabditis brenneri]